MGIIKLMRTAHECRNLDEIRSCIDSIDKDLIDILSKRMSYVHAASKFKKNNSDVRADDRVKLMLETRKMWAKESGIDQDFIAELFGAITSFFISEEMKKWNEDK
jgi:isochorismate pyruvate lyase